ncbi:hypothetical protein J6590_019754 [Homalodisca vitripennis]|nr:hypothetical protein J6590_019754 [Homalodisca vitripennis]
MFAEKSRCRLCDLLSGTHNPQLGDQQLLPASPSPFNVFLPQLRDMMLAAWFLRGGTVVRYATIRAIVILLVRVGLSREPLHATVWREGVSFGCYVKYFDSLRLNVVSIVGCLTLWLSSRSLAEHPVHMCLTTIRKEQ